MTPSGGRGARRRLLLSGVGAIGLAGCLPPRTPESRPDTAATSGLHRVVRVQDGDSFIARAIDGREIRVRIAAIDAPEREQAGGEAARQWLQARLQGHDVRLDGYKTDRYGRLVSNVFRGPDDVGLDMVRQGLAWHNRPWAHEQSLEARARYAQAELAARHERRGLWGASPAALEPWRWRRDNAARAARDPAMTQPRAVPLD